VVQKAQTIQELAMSDAAVSKYVIPGLLAVDHRVIITARPGSGKSTFIKFMGLCAAQGIHPFKHSHMKPARVLSVDAENPGESILSTMIPLESTLMKYSDCFDEERFKIFRSPGGLNIRKRRQRTELQREIALHRPDIVVAGPIYKLNRRESGESYESAAEDFVDILDDLRTKYNFALILEAHPPKNSEEWTPMGSITLSNWAEVGMYLKKENPGDHHVTVGHFREDRLQGLGYPKSMDWSADWCFEGAF
jgi:replicative DNA helicase